MIEATTYAQTQSAFDAAHAARGEALRELFTAIRALFTRNGAKSVSAPVALAH